MPDELYTIHSCAPRLSPFVRRYLYADAIADATIRPGPTGYVYLGHLFNSGDLFAIIDGAERRCRSRWHFSGQIRDKEIAVRQTGHIGHLLAEFTPTGFYRLLKIPASRITNLSTDVVEIDAALDRKLQPALAGMHDREQRLCGFDAMLSSMIPDALPEVPHVDRAAAMLEQCDGDMRISALCAELGISPRHLNRMFGDIVGISPKYFAQVRQINHVLALLYGGDSAALSALAQDCGYYDQAHFIKAMQRFFNEGPQQFLRSRHPLLSTFLAKSRLGASENGLDESNRALQ